MNTKDSILVIILGPFVILLCFILFIIGVICALAGYELDTQYKRGNYE